MKHGLFRLILLLCLVALVSENVSMSIKGNKVEKGN